jgi:hypothetical protein
MSQQLQRRAHDVRTELCEPLLGRRSLRSVRHGVRRRTDLQRGPMRVFLREFALQRGVRSGRQSELQRNVPRVRPLADVYDCRLRLVSSKGVEGRFERHPVPSSRARLRCEHGTELRGFT